MLLTVSKRLEFSASRRLFVKEWSEAENRVNVWAGNIRALRHRAKLRRAISFFPARSIPSPGC